MINEQEIRFILIVSSYCNKLFPGNPSHLAFIRLRFHRILKAKSGSFPSQVTPILKFTFAYSKKYDED